MRNPIEVSLKYRDERNGFVTLRVDPISNAEYVWQKCKYKTAVWEKIGITTSNYKMESISSTLNKGDKYRCVISVNGIVTHYSNTFLVSEDKFTANSKTEQSGSKYRTDNNYYKKSEASVSDTDGMDGLAFEYYCSNVLRKNGFYEVEVTKGSGDYGIDILAKKDSISYAIQCKCYKDKVSNKAVQEAYSGKSFYGCMVAVVLTNNYFTESAKETAKHNNVLLWDRDYLDQMIRNPGATKSSNSYEYRKHNDNSNSKRNNQAEGTSKGTIDFFEGCNNFNQVKARYRDLMKKYHPDNENGDEEYAKIINVQYETLKKKYGQ